MLRKIMAGLILIAMPTLCFAQQQLTYDRVNFSVSAKEEVENDTVTSVVYAQREGSDSGSLAEAVNKEITWAVKMAKKVPALKVQTENYQTSPLYSKQTLTGWRVRQSISLETRDAKALSELLGQLQQHIAIQSISYSISPARRQEVEKQLIAEALSRFTKQADLITRQLDRSDYRIVNLDIHTGEVRPVHPMARGAMMMDENASFSPPALETGTNTLTVTVNGTIELQIR